MDKLLPMYLYGKTIYCVEDCAIYILHVSVMLYDAYAYN